MARYLLCIFICVVFSISVKSKPQDTSANAQQQPQYDEWRAAWQHLQAAFQNVGNWFVRQYRTVQSWFARSRQELEKKVQDMANFLGTVKDNMDALVQGAGAQLQGALQHVNNYYTDVLQFQQKLRDDVSSSFQALEDEWQRKVQNMYNGGLDKIIGAAEAAKMDVRQQNPAPVADTGNSTANQ